MQVKGTDPTNASVSQDSAISDARDSIRNIAQTHAEYPIIKMVPDTVIYIDNLPYLINDYIGDGGVLFNFNDYVTSASGAVDVATWIPTCSITLSVPNDLKHMLMAPGGQRILKAMSDIKVFTKGYYLTQKGESVYHRVFWGVVSTVTYADNRKTLEVSLSCNGIMRVFDLMQYNQAPSVTTALHSGTYVTPFKDKASSLSALCVILQTFLSPLTNDVIDSETLAAQNAKLPNNVFSRSYASKWSPKLLNLQKSVRLYGLAKDDLRSIEKFVSKDPSGKNAGLSGSERLSADVYSKDEVERPQMIVDSKMISDFLPNYTLGSIELLQSQITSRLARIQAMVECIGWEGYQDLDGSVVIKPPLYNLDCTLTDRDGPNPFVINLPEVIGTESEVEDESQVRLTRSTVHGLLGSTPVIENCDNLVPHTTFFDPGLIRQFGIRSEPSKQVRFLANNANALYAYAVSEMTKINKRWRTYTVTIPMRPELRVGFPIYIPHLDIYAYLENISWNYQRGGTCTMTLSGTNVRYRELFAKEKTTHVPGEAAGEPGTKQWIYTSVPNLEWVWCTEANAQPIDSKNRVTDPTGSSGTQAATLPGQELSPQQEHRIQREKRSHPDTSTAPDNPTNAWRVSGDSGKFSKQRPVDADYYNLITTSTMPYTDGKGYTLLRPFPWGRFVTLESALDLFTRAKAHRTGKLLPFEPKGSADPSRPAAINDSFLMAALGTPSMTSTDPTKGTPTDKAVYVALKAIQDTVSDDLNCFVLSYDSDSGATSQESQNPHNAGGVTDVPLGASPDAGTPTPSRNPIQAATDFVNAFTKSNIESDFVQ